MTLVLLAHCCISWSTGTLLVIQADMCCSPRPVETVRCLRVIRIALVFGALMDYCDGEAPVTSWPWVRWAVNWDLDAYAWMRVWTLMIGSAWKRSQHTWGGENVSLCVCVCVCVVDRLHLWHLRGPDHCPAGPQWSREVDPHEHPVWHLPPHWRWDYWPTAFTLGLI